MTTASQIAVHDQHEARYKAGVMHETWGHLEPKPGLYPGWLVFANGTCDDRIIIDWDFAGVNACPGVHFDVEAFIDEKCDGRASQTGVYRLDGTYRRFKNGKGRVAGRLRKIKT